MFLSDRDITSAIETGMLVVEPTSPSMVQPASLEVRLAAQMRLVEPDGSHTSVELTDGAHLVMPPGARVLASTMERVVLPANMLAKFEGKSTLGRRWLLTHVTAGFIDPGFAGTITLELANIGPHDLQLEPGQRIGQLAFAWLTTSAVRPYGHPELGSHYQHQDGPTPAHSGSLR